MQIVPPLEQRVFLCYIIIMLITSLYAGILGLLFFFISIETIKARRSKQISLGAGSNNEIQHLVSAHSNFSSYAGFFLLALALSEYSRQFPMLLLHVLGLVFVVGRILHFLSMRTEVMDFKKRVAGMMMTLFPLVLISLMNVWVFVRSLR